jgi:hypothetical protein
MIEYLRLRSEAITFNILSSNTLIPEIIEINPPTKQTITVLADSFFTNIVCNESVDGLYMNGAIPNVSRLDAYIKQLGWWRGWEYKYMTTKAKASIWMEKELFRRIAKFTDT